MAASACQCVVVSQLTEYIGELVFDHGGRCVMVGTRWTEGSCPRGGVVGSWRVRVRGVG